MKTMLKITLVVGLLLLSGCAAQTGVKSRYFWPIGGMDPKIEYVDFYDSDRSIKKVENAFSQAILGVEEAKLLFVSPHGIGIRDADVFAVTDPGLSKVVVVDLAKGEARTISNSDGGEYFFAFPMAVTYRADGGGYISDAGKGRIYRFDANETVIQEIGGSDGLRRPNGLAYDDKSGKLYVADTLNHQIAVFDSDGKLALRIGKRGIEGGEFNFPLDVALSASGELVILDALNARVQILQTDGSFVRMFGERGTAAGSFSMPKGLAVDGFGHVYVSDGRAHRIVVFDIDGNYLLSVGAHAAVIEGKIHPGGLDFPKGIVADAAGRILIVDSLNRMVHRYQYLSEDYLKQNPILEEQRYVPEELR